MFYLFRKASYLSIPAHSSPTKEIAAKDETNVVDAKITGTAGEVSAIEQPKPTAKRRGGDCSTTKDIAVKDETNVVDTKMTVVGDPTIEQPKPTRKRRGGDSSEKSTKSKSYRQAIEQSKPMRKRWRDDSSEKSSRSKSCRHDSSQRREKHCGSRSDSVVKQKAVKREHRGQQRAKEEPTANFTDGWVHFFKVRYCKGTVAEVFFLSELKYFKSGSGYKKSPARSDST